MTGQRKVGWGRVDEHSDYSLVYAYPDRAGQCDSRVLMDALEGKRYIPTFAAPGFKVEPSAMKELESRGYDLTTLKLTISKKADAVS